MPNYCQDHTGHMYMVCGQNVFSANLAVRTVTTKMYMPGVTSLTSNLSSVTQGRLISVYSKQTNEPRS